MRTVVFPYKMGSDSGKRLAQKLGSLRVYAEGNYRPKNEDVIINWGNSNPPPWHTKDVPVLNKYADVKLATNKRTCFGLLELSNVPIPQWTEDFERAKDWLADGCKVVCRTVLNGHGGAGIVLAETPDELVHAPLYTVYVPKKHEYRIHVFAGKVIDIAEKRMRNKADRPENFNQYIRNHDNGWVFCRNDVEPPMSVLDCAVEATKALNLDFGAVDVIYRQSVDQAYVLEVNTAPGMDEHTSEAYASAIQQHAMRPAMPVAPALYANVFRVERAPNLQPEAIGDLYMFEGP